MSTSGEQDNGLVCFTNCFLPLEDGTLVERDLWIDAEKGVILDAQRTFYTGRRRPKKVIDLQGNILSPGFIDVQINGAYGFDFSIYDGDDDKYEAGLKMVAERIVETGVTSLLPTVITQERSLYPKLLSLLHPHSFPSSANLLGWHAEGPFLQGSKRGAHAQSFLVNAPAGLKSIEEVYGKDNLAAGEDNSVRVITAAPELEGLMESIGPLSEQGVIFSIGHSTASSRVATAAVRCGARLVTHLFNAMPQLHHRDPSIIGLLGAGGPHSSSLPPTPSHSKKSSLSLVSGALSAKSVRGGGTEALTEGPSAFGTPGGSASPMGANAKSDLHAQIVALGESLEGREAFQRPYYGIIVDGIHSHPNSVRLAYTAHPEGCILVTDAMAMLDPHLPDGVHEWRDGKRLVKNGERLFIEGTDTLAGSVVTMDTCVRKFKVFTSTSIGQAILCATYNPAKCLGIENKKGTLRGNADADFVVLSHEGKVLSTWVAGREVWKKA